MVEPAEDPSEPPATPGPETPEVDAGAAAADGSGVARPGFLFEIEVSTVVLVAAVGGLCVTAFAIMRSSPQTVTRVGIGVLLAVALNPIVTKLQHRGLRRGLAVAIVAAAVVLVFTLVLTLLAPQAVSQAREFSRELPSTVKELYNWPVIGPRLQRADAAASVQTWVDELPTKLDDKTLSSLAEAVLGGALATIIVVVTALAVLLDAESLVERVGGLSPPSHRDQTRRMGQVLYRTFGSYFAGTLLVAVLNGLVVLTAGLALGVPLAPLAAVWSTLTNMIPQVGGFLGGSFFILLALTKSPVTALLAAVIFLGYQQFENNVIQPAVIGTAVNLTPPTTMLAALIGGAAAGVPGALVATPLLGALKALYLESRSRPLPERKLPVLQRLRQTVRRRGRRGGHPDAPEGAA
jgi:predicted PurR-regulated permease PerM